MVPSDEGGKITTYVDSVSTHPRIWADIQAEHGTMGGSLMRWSSFVIVTSMALVMSGPVVGAEPAWIASVEDPTGDLADFGGFPIPGPAVADLVGLTLAIDGDDLAARFDLAGDWETAATESLTDMTYTLVVDGDAIDGPIHVIVSLDGNGWGARVWGLEPTLLDEVTVADGAVSIRVPLSVLGAPDGLLFQAQSMFSDFPPEGVDLGDGEVGKWTQWFDRVPDAHDRFLTLSSGVVNWSFLPEPSDGVNG